MGIRIEMIKITAKVLSILIPQQNEFEATRL